MDTCNLLYLKRINALHTSGMYLYVKENIVTGYIHKLSIRTQFSIIVVHFKVTNSVSLEEEGVFFYPGYLKLVQPVIEPQKSISTNFMKQTREFYKSKSDILTKPEDSTNSKSEILTMQCMEVPKVCAHLKSGPRKGDLQIQNLKC